MALLIILLSCSLVSYFLIRINQTYSFRTNLLQLVIDSNGHKNHEFIFALWKKYDYDHTLKKSLFMLSFNIEYEYIFGEEISNKIKMIKTEIDNERNKIIMESLK